MQQSRVEWHWVGAPALAPGGGRSQLPVRHRPGRLDGYDPAAARAQRRGGADQAWAARDTV